MSIIRRSLLLAAVVAVSLHAGERERPQTYEQRRLALAKKHSDGLIVLFGYGEREAQDARSPFRQENNFYYLTGWNEPGAVLLLLPANTKQSSHGEILFLPEKNGSRERWTGPRTGSDEPDLDQKTEFSDVRDVSTLAPVVKEALGSYERVYGLLPWRHPSLAQQPEPDWTKRLRKLAGGYPMSNVRGSFGEMRMVKSEPEIQLIRRAVGATVQAHLAAWEEDPARSVRVPGGGSPDRTADESLLPETGLRSDRRRGPESNDPALHEELRSIAKRRTGSHRRWGRIQPLCRRHHADRAGRWPFH